MPPDPKKIQALRANGTLNPHPEKVRVAHFAEREFFDPHDLVQIKYETLRLVTIDHLDSLFWPAQYYCLLLQTILPMSAFGVFEYLPQSGLPDI